MDVTAAMPADRPRIDKEKAPTKTCRICSDSFVCAETLEELGPNMFGVVSGSLRVKAWVTSRLEWALARQDEWPE